MWSSLSSGAKDRIGTAAERWWSLCFKWLNHDAARHVRRWSPQGGQVVLVIAPHPDDEVCGCAGVIALHGRVADQVCVVYVTDGRGSRALGLTPDKMAQRRRQEAYACARVLGVHAVEWLGAREGEWRPGDVQPRLASLLRAHAPQIIYAPSRVDFHPEHLKVSHALARTLRDDAACELRVYQVQVPLTPVLTNCVADVSGVSETCTQAFATYTTQGASIQRALRMRRYAARVYGCTLLAEEFWQMSAPAYKRLHEDTSRGQRAPPFRAMHARAFADLLAYTSGLRDRRRLAHAVARV